MQFINSIHQFPFSQPSENSDFVSIIKDLSAPCISCLTSSIDHRSCCTVSERLKIGIQIYERTEFLFNGQINIVLTNEEQLNDIIRNDLFPFENEENIKSSVPWYHHRCQLEFTKKRLLIVNNNTITFDPISGVPLPTNYYDPDTKENICTLKNEFISLIVIDALSSSPEDQDFKSKLIESLITEGKWAKCGMNHNLIIPIFLNANFTDPVLIAFSGLIGDSEIFIGQAVQQAMSMTIWNSFWLRNEKFFSAYERIQKTNIFLYYKRSDIILLSRQFRLSIIQLCQIFSQFPITANESWLIHIILKYVSISVDILRHSEMKLPYLNDFVSYSFTENPNQKNKLHNEINFGYAIDTSLFLISACLSKLPSCKPSDNSRLSSWMMKQLFEVLIDLNFSVFGLYIDECDFDLNLKFSTTYQKDAASERFCKTSSNLIECFCSNATFGKRIPLPISVNIIMDLPDKYNLIFSSCLIKKFVPFIMAFLKLTMNQIMYCPEHTILPVWSSAVELNDNELNFTGLFVVLETFRIILKSVSELEENLYNIACIQRYIIELIYQTVCPLVECKMIITSDILSDSETYNVWVDLKQMFESFPRPKQVALTIKDYKTLSMSGIIRKRWTDVDIQFEWYRNFLDRLTGYICTMKKEINSASLGLQRWNKYLSNKPHLFSIPPFKAARYIDEIRSALHFQFAMLFLTPEGLSRHFKELQENAWRCHPLYSPDLYSFRPPHCAIPEPIGATNSMPELARSTSHISTAGQTGDGTPNPSPLFSTLGLEVRRPPGFSGPPANWLAWSNEDFSKQRNAFSSDATSGITSVSAQLEEDFERLMVGESNARQRLVHEADWDKHSQAEPGEHKHIGHEAINEERIALDRHDPDRLDNLLQHEDGHEGASNYEAL